MPTFDPVQLAAWTGGRWTTVPAAPLTGFQIDSRRTTAGDIFVALRTGQRDGHAFVAAAAAAGAAAALVARPVAESPLPQLVVADPLRAFQAVAAAHRRAFPGRVIGISGSAGKTSTKELLARLLGGEAGGVLATEGNLNNLLGVPLTLTRLDAARHTTAVIEAGISEPGEMEVLAGMIDPDLSLITLVAAAHTEALGGLEGVAREKARLPAATRAGGVAVFPRSAAAWPPFQSLPVRCLVVERADVIRPTAPPPDHVFFAVSHRGARTAVSLATGDGRPRVFTCRRVSDGLAQNAALALAAAQALGVPERELRARMADWGPAALRGEVREDRGRLVYVDCYNANPASMADALATFEAVAPHEGPRLFVLGCMEELGPDSPEHHRALGRSLRLREDDRLFVTGTQAAAVREGLAGQGLPPGRCEVVESLEPVAAVFAAWPGAVFVKGSRRYQLERILGPGAAAH